MGQHSLNVVDILLYLLQMVSSLVSKERGKTVSLYLLGGLFFFSFRYLVWSYLLPHMSQFGLKSNILLGWILSSWFSILVFVVCTVPLFSSTLTWKELISEKYLRWLIISLIVLVTWQYSMYDYNFYVDALHLFDRLLLLGLGGLAIFTPRLLPFFILQLVAILSQFQVGFSAAAYGGNILAYDFLIGVVVLIYYRIGESHLRRYTILDSYAEASLPLYFSAYILGHYVSAGIYKILIGSTWYDWVLHLNLQYLWLHYFNQGWMSWVSLETAEGVASVFSSASPFLALGTLLLELLCIFLFFKPRTAHLWFGGFLLFHVSFLALTGIFFFYWILIDAFLLIIWLSKNVNISSSEAWAGVLLTVMFSVLVVPGPAWFQMPTASVVEVSATTLEGKEVVLPWSAYHPYDYHVMKESIGSLSNVSRIDGFNANIRSYSPVILQASTEEQVEGLYYLYGETSSSDQRVTEIQAWLESLRQKPDVFFNDVPTLHHSYYRQGSLKSDDTMCDVSVWHTRYSYVNNTISVLDTTKVYEKRFDCA